MSEHKISELQQQERARQFGLAVHQGLLSPLDRFKSPLRVGDKIIYRPPYDMVFEIAEIKPILDPRRPTGLVTLVLQCTAEVPVPVRTPLGMIILLGQGPQDQASPPSNGQGQEAPAAEDPPPDLPGGTLEPVS